MYRDFISLLTVTVILAGALAAKLVHADAGNNPLHPQYYTGRVSIAPVANAAVVDAGESRNPLHPRYVHSNFNGRIAPGDAQVMLALLQEHNPLHPMFIR